MSSTPYTYADGTTQFMTLGTNQEGYDYKAGATVTYPDADIASIFGPVLLPRIYAKDLDVLEIGSSGQVIVSINDETSIAFRNNESNDITYIEGKNSNQIHIAPADANATTKVGNMTIDSSGNYQRLVTTDASGFEILNDARLREDMVMTKADGRMKVPVGTSAQRPTLIADASYGMVRYNTDTNAFEGYHDSGIGWRAFGGTVVDTDGDTKILAELSAGGDEDTLFFDANGVRVMEISEAETKVFNKLSVAENVTFAKELSVAGAVAMASTLSVAAAADICGAVVMRSTLSVADNGFFAKQLSVAGAATMASTLSVGDIAEISGAVTMGSTLSVADNAALKKQLTVDGAAALGSTLSVADIARIEGAAALGSTLSVADNGFFAKQLSVAGAATMASTLSVGDIAEISGAVTMGSTLSVADDATLAKQLSVAGAATLASTLSVGDTAEISGAVTMGSTLSVAGAAVMQSTLSVADDGFFAKQLSVAGAVAMASTLSVGAAADICGAVVMRSTLSVGNNGFFAKQLSVAGAATMASTLSVGDIAHISGAVTMGSTLSVADDAALAKKLTVDGAAVLKSTLSVADTVDICGAVVMSSTLSVADDATLNKQLSVGGAVAMASTLTVSNATTLNATLSVAGVTTLNNDVSVAGDVYINTGKSMHVNTVKPFSGSELIVDASNLYIKGSVDILGTLNTMDVTETTLSVEDKLIKVAVGADGASVTDGLATNHDSGLLVYGDASGHGLTTPSNGAFEKSVKWTMPAANAWVNMSKAATNNSLPDEPAWQLRGGNFQIMNMTYENGEGVRYVFRTNDNKELEIWKSSTTDNGTTWTDSRVARFGVSI